MFGGTGRSVISCRHNRLGKELKIIISNILLVLVAICGLTFQCQQIQLLTGDVFHKNARSIHSHQQNLDQSHEHNCHSHCKCVGNYDCCDDELRAVLFSSGVFDNLRVANTRNLVLVSKPTLEKSQAGYSGNSDPPNFSLRERVKSLSQSPNSPPASAQA